MPDKGNGVQDGKVANLNLPIHPRMLSVDNKTGIGCSEDDFGRPIYVSTAYVVLDLAEEKNTGNISPILYTRPAANIIFLDRNKEGEVMVGLVRRERPAVGDEMAKIVIKACGGYFHDGSQGDLHSFVEMVRCYVGLRVRVEDLHLCGNSKYGYVSDPGHGGIRTPIAFTYATAWEIDPDVVPKMELIWIPLAEAVEWCFETLNNMVGTWIEDTSSTFSILNVEHLIKTKQIKVPTKRNIDLADL